MENPDSVWPDCESNQWDCDSNELPLRVIHLTETISSDRICFHTPSAWNFHVISHTWSQGLRDFSQRIGEDIQLDHDINKSGLSEYHIVHRYNLAFHNANLTGSPCFKELMQLFELLCSDGVQAIWIDALCINQTDLTEKSREIARMGDYYKKSNGCYVLTHGIDQGYMMWKKVGTVPRWFTRVWTLQELVLPKNLFFIVTCYNPQTIAYINHCILKWGDPEVGFCKCILFSAFMSPYALLDIMDTDFAVEYPSTHILLGARDCQVCRSRPIRQVRAMSSCCTKELGVEGEIQRVYLIERNAYFLLAHVDTRFSIPFEIPLSFNGMGNFFEDQNRLLQDLLGQEICRPILVIQDICNRQCSVEEDRVLSILGLLNADQHMKQLRVGRDLQHQIISLTRAKLQAQDQDFMIQMMVMDMEGCHSMQHNMPWAPDFWTNDKRSIGHLQTVAEQRMFNRCVDVVEVTDEGKVRLDGAKVAWVRMSIHAAGSRLYDYASPISGSYILSIHSEVWGSQGFKLVVKSMRGDPYTGRISVFGRDRSILQLAPTLEFDAWFVLLATFHCTDNQGRERDGNFTMICLSGGEGGLGAGAGEDDRGVGAQAAAGGGQQVRHPDLGELHKVGLFDLGCEACKLMFHEDNIVAERVSCTLAGSSSPTRNCKRRRSTSHDDDDDQAQYGPSLEDANNYRVHCRSWPEPLLKWTINQHNYSIQQVQAV